MYHKAFGIMETLAPLHVGASAGEETGNLNLIFRDQFTQTGIVPGSSIRGRFRADMRHTEGRDESQWYGHEAVAGQTDGGTTEAEVKFEYASLVWLPVFCPGQPVVWVTCPWLLKRYRQTTKDYVDLPNQLPDPYSASKGIQGRLAENNQKVLFFNLGFIRVNPTDDLEKWLPQGTNAKPDSLVVVKDNDMGMIHDMALYRQSRVRLADKQKKVDGSGFFNVEALPEGSILVFPIALRKTGWHPFGEDEHEAKIKTAELYFGGLESVGFGRCQVTLGGKY
jgi:CRISPR-associated protein Cmr4